MIWESMSQLRVIQQNVERHVAKKVIFATLLDVPGVQCGHIQHWPNIKTNILNKLHVQLRNIDSEIQENLTPEKGTQWGSQRLALTQNRLHRLLHVLLAKVHELRREKTHSK